MGREHSRVKKKSCGCPQNLVPPVPSLLCTHLGTYLITSPVWSLNSMSLIPASRSQSMQLMSPLDVKICRSLRKRQQERYPECALNSRATLTDPSLVRRL